MSLIRTGIVIAAVIAVLPTDKGQQQKLYAQAVTLMGDAATYCERNPDTCARANEYWQTFKVKAAFAGQLAWDALQSHVEGQTAFQQSGPQPASGPAPLALRQQGTLTARDLETAWRGPIRKSN